MRLRYLLVSSLTALAFMTCDARASSDLVLVFDASGSMWGQIQGENKIVIARKVLGDLVDGLPDDQRVGLVAYGHRREGDCDDIELVSPLAGIDKSSFKATVNGLNPKGKTPITQSVQRAFDVVKQGDGKATVILISDGLETCGGDPCAAVRAAKASGIDFVMHVIGFDVAGEDVSQLECAAQAGDGLFLSAENADELGAALDAAVAMPVDVPPGRLSVKTMADGALHDASVTVTDRATGEQINGSRTYTDPSTNPRVLPLPDGSFHVKVHAVGLKGDAVREFDVDIAEGNRVEKEFDFSTGEIVIGVTRNGELSDATYKVRVASTGKQAAGGRTYTRSAHNPSTVRITSGQYTVSVKSVEISSKKAEVDLGQVKVEPKGARRAQP